MLRPQALFKKIPTEVLPGLIHEEEVKNLHFAERKRKTHWKMLVFS